MTWPAGSYEHHVGAPADAAEEDRDDETADWSHHLSTVHGLQMNDSDLGTIKSAHDEDHADRAPGVSDSENTLGHSSHSSLRQPRIVHFNAGTLD